MNIIQHAEKYLGNREPGGWANPEDEFKVIYFKNCPDKSLKTFLTIGVSAHVFHISKTKKVSFEFVYTVGDEVCSDLIASFLFYIGEAVILRHKAILRGEVIPLSEEAKQKIGFDAVYCTSPIYFDDDFGSLDVTNPPTVIVCLIPIYHTEHHFIINNSWGKFEDILVEKQPDLWLLSRPSVVDYCSC